MLHHFPQWDSLPRPKSHLRLLHARPAPALSRWGLSWFRCSLTQRRNDAEKNPPQHGEHRVVASISMAAAARLWRDIDALFPERSYAPHGDEPKSIWMRSRLQSDFAGGGDAKIDRTAPLLDGGGCRRCAGRVGCVSSCAGLDPHNCPAHVAAGTAARQCRSNYADYGVYASFPRAGSAARCGESGHQDGGPQLWSRRQRLVVVVGFRRHRHVHTPWPPASATSR